MLPVVSRLFHLYYSVALRDYKFTHDKYIYYKFRCNGNEKEKKKIREESKEKD